MAKPSEADAAMLEALAVQKSEWEHRWYCFKSTGVPVMEQVIMERGLTHTQAETLDWIMRFLVEADKELDATADASSLVMRLFGYAGTGKTTVASALAATMPPGSIRFCAFVGQAVDVLRNKGCLPANTIHSLIYTPRIDEDTDEVLGFDKRANNTYRDEGLALIVVDEGSMVDDELFADLQAVAGVPILVLGDDFQLPPVNGKASLMEGCDLKLTEVLRQAEGSPVIQLATHVRKYGCLPPDVVGYMDDERKCRITPKSLTESIRNGSYIDEWQIVCGTNNTRVHLNRVVRKELGYKGVCPMIGERIVITRNDTDIGVFNGQQFRVKDILLVDDELRYAFIHVVKVDSHFTRNLLIDLKALDGDGPDKDDPNFWRMRKARNEMIAHNCHHRLCEDGVVPIGINTKLRVAEIDFAYALTVHKMQGSQSRNIVIVDQSYVFRDQASRWLYTGITRAVDKVHIFKRE